MVVTPVAERRVFRVFAIAQPDILIFFEGHFERAVGHTFNLFVCAIAEGDFFTHATSTPGIGFSGFYMDLGWTRSSYFGERRHLYFF